MTQFAYISLNMETREYELKESAQGSALGTTGVVFGVADTAEELLTLAGERGIQVSTERMASGRAARIAYEKALGC